MASGNANGLTVDLYGLPNGLRRSDNEVTIVFRDTVSGAPVDVGTVKFALDMNMPGMVMHSGSTIAPAGKPGRYRAKVRPEMAGDWTAKLNYDGPRGRGAVSFIVGVAQ